MADPGENPSIPERLGGWWAISWQAYVITAPVAVIAPVAFARSANEVLPWMLMGAVAFAAVGAWTYLMHRTIFRNRRVRPVSMVRFGLNALAVSAIYVVVAGGLGFLLGITDANHLVPSPIPTAIFATGWSTVLILILESQWRFHTQREELIEQAVQQQLTALQELNVLDQIRSAISDEVGEELEVARQRLETRIDALVDQGDGEIAAIADELRATADTTVRPLSHRLAERSEQRTRRPGLLTVLGNVFRYQPFRPVIVSAVYVVVALPSEFAQNTYSEALLAAVITITLIFATMSLVNLAMRRLPQHHAVLFVAGIAFVQMPTIAFAVFSEPLNGAPASPLDTAATVTLGAFVIVMTSAFGSWNRTRQDIIKQFAREVREEEIAALARGAAVAEVAQEASTILHGSLQSQLRACAGSIQRAADQGDILEVNRALVQARAILEDPMPSLTRDADSSLESAVNRKANEWAGLATMHLDLDPGVAQIRGALAAHVADVVEEGIANAVHHGSASQVLVRIVFEGDELVVTVRDNGRGPGKGSPGLGSRLFSRVGGVWNLEVQDPGSLLTVRLAPSGLPSAR